MVGGTFIKAHEIMKSNVLTVQENETVRSVIEKFLENGISGLPVINQKNEIVAYISDGDIMRFIGKHKDIIVSSFFFVDVIRGDDEEFEERVKRMMKLNVMEIAQKKVVTVQYDESAENIASILGNKHIKKLPVERDGVLAGIISRGDVVRNAFQALL